MLPSTLSLRLASRQKSILIEPSSSYPPTAPTFKSMRSLSLDLLMDPRPRRPCVTALSRLKASCRVHSPPAALPKLPQPLMGRSRRAPWVSFQESSRGCLRYGLSLKMSSEPRSAPHTLHTSRVRRTSFTRTFNAQQSSNGQSSRGRTASLPGGAARAPARSASAGRVLHTRQSVARLAAVQL